MIANATNPEAVASSARGWHNPGSSVPIQFQPRSGLRRGGPRAAFSATPSELVPASGLTQGCANPGLMPKPHWGLKSGSGGVVTARRPG